MKNSVKKMIAGGGLLVLLFLFVLIHTLVDQNAKNKTGESGQSRPEEVEGQHFAQADVSSLLPESEDSKTWEKIVTNSAFQLGEFFDDDDVEEGYTKVSYGTYPVLDGSTVAVPMAVEFARQHLGFSEENAAEFVFFSTTSYAYNFLIEGNHDSGSGSFTYQDITATMAPSEHVDLIIATEPSAEERALAEKRKVELVVKPVCLDAFVFITGKDNPVESLTVEQIQKIYSGEITNWKEVGGTDMPILAYQRNPNSGSQTGMEILVMQGKEIKPALTIRIGEMMGLIDAVSDQERLSSIGYTYLYYISEQVKDENIKTLKINGIVPTAENIRSKQYPFTTAYYGVIRGGDEQKTGGKFLDWMLSEDGQRCIGQAGYIPLN